METTCYVILSNVALLLGPILVQEVLLFLGTLVHQKYIWIYAPKHTCMIILVSYCAMLYPCSKHLETMWLPGWSHIVQYGPIHGSYICMHMTILLQYWHNIVPRITISWVIYVGDLELCCWHSQNDRKDYFLAYAACMESKINIFQKHLN